MCVRLCGRARGAVPVAALETKSLVVACVLRLRGGERRCLEGHASRVAGRAGTAFAGRRAPPLAERARLRLRGRAPSFGYVFRGARPALVAFAGVRAVLWAAGARAVLRGADAAFVRCVYRDTACRAACRGCCGVYAPPGAACVFQRRQGLSTGLASSVSSSRTATLTRSRKATQTRTVRETKHAGAACVTTKIGQFHQHGR